MRRHKRFITEEERVEQLKIKFTNVFRFKNTETQESYLLGTDEPFEESLHNFAKEQGITVFRVGFWIFQGKGSEYCA